MNDQNKNMISLNAQKKLSICLEMVAMVAMLSYGSYAYALRISITDIRLFYTIWVYMLRFLARGPIPFLL